MILSRSLNICCFFTLACLSTGSFAQDTVTSDTTSIENSDWSKREFWQTTSGDPVSAGWQFADGEISLVEPRKGGNIVTPPMPPNFELSWKWKIEKGVNSGLKYRVRKFGQHLFVNNYLGLEYQIIDSKPDSDSMSSTASIYALVPSCKRQKTVSTR